MGITNRSGNASKVKKKRAQNSIPTEIIESRIHGGGAGHPPQAMALGSRRRSRSLLPRGKRGAPLCRWCGRVTRRVAPSSWMKIFRGPKQILQKARIGRIRKVLLRRALEFVVPVTKYWFQAESAENSVEHQ